MLAPIKDLFFRRMKSLKGELPDFYIYKLTKEIRHKIIGTIFDYRYEHNENPFKQDYNEIDEFVVILERELGRNISAHYDSNKKIQEFLFTCGDEEFLSALELLISIKSSNKYRFSYVGQLLETKLLEFIHKINAFFKIDKFGYEIVPAGLEDLPFIIVPFNSKYLHLETIKLPMDLLYDEKFKGALNEFQKSLEKSRNKDYEGAILEANNSYESTLKTILYLKEIKFDETKDKIPHLIEKIRVAGIIESTFESTFNTFWPVLKNGPNNIRNLAGIAHGQGVDVKEIQKTYADFVIRIVGTYIVFLIEKYRETR